MVALPWSTSLVAIFAILMLIALGPFLDIEALTRTLMRQVAMVPVALFVLALVGTLWSPAPWGERLYGQRRRISASAARPTSSAGAEFSPCA